MKKKLVAITHIISVIAVAIIGIIQIALLSRNPFNTALYSSFRLGQAITVGLAAVVIAMLMRKAGFRRNTRNTDREYASKKISPAFAESVPKASVTDAACPLFGANTDEKVNALSDSGGDWQAGMDNRNAFISAVENILRVTGPNRQMALVCSDIKNFRFHNEFLGYQQGNVILQQFAAELRRQPFCRCAFRLYSDNFAFLADFSGQTREQAADTVQNWNWYFTSLINQTHKGSRLIVKSGIYFITDATESVEAMLNRAHLARKAANTSFRHVVIHSSAISQIEQDRADVINSFQHALENEEFKVFVQPKVRLSDKSVCGAEALVRWQRPDGTYLGPDRFVPIFEQTGDIVDLDFYVFEQVFRYLSERHAEGKPVLPLSVNVSRVHLSMIPCFICRLRKLHSQYPVSPQLITFELTEGAYIEGVDSANHFIDELHQMGYRVAMDDFGSGYSSLKALQPMTFDEIKFDRAFLCRDTDEKNRRILLQMLTLLKSLYPTIVCEGVETAESVKLLEQSDCDIVQGYYFFKPFPLEHLFVMKQAENI